MTSSPTRVDRARCRTVVVAHADAEVSDPNDPWASRPAEAPKAFSLVDDKLPPEKRSRRGGGGGPEAANDTRLVFSVQLGEMRAVSATREMLDTIAAHPKVASLGIVLPPCAKASSPTPSGWCSAPPASRNQMRAR